MFVFVCSREGWRSQGGIQRTNKNADEGETFLAEVEAVDVYEDNGERFEPDIEEAVYEGYVKVQEKDYRLEI